MCFVKGSVAMRTMVVALGKEDKSGRPECMQNDLSPHYAEGGMLI